MEYRRYRVSGNCGNCRTASSQEHMIPIGVDRITAGCRTCGITVQLYLPSQGRTIAYKGFGISVEVTRQ